MSRYDCGDPPPYYSHRRSTHPEDGINFIICNS
ncbi:unnamed protein product [Onchocerca flexuosa]|uniref:Uncharacterized protein n=1 Tax=Onchocerca flexuosa TaxID=387005 RepID=A0A183HKT9_9BILA|nr:unnamed protein product [Onchocerca flexuosa]